jgi:hypothetical protein
MNPITMGALLALQCFEVLFLFLHDWIPLGSLNDLKGVRTADSFGKRVAATLISSTPFAVGLIGSVIYFGKPYPTGFSGGCGSATDFYSAAYCKRGGFRTCSTRSPSASRAIK